VRPQPVGAAPVVESPSRPTDDPRSAARARVRLIVWCWDCSHQGEPLPPLSPGWDRAPGEGAGNDKNNFGSPCGKMA
jgi:hypothetical protein